MSSPALETDPVKVQAAERLLRHLQHLEVLSSKEYEQLLAVAGKALANRYCFGLQVTDEGSDSDSEASSGGTGSTGGSSDDLCLEACITRIDHFQAHKCVLDTTEPIHALLPGCCEEMEARWSFEQDLSPLEAGRYLQSLGFHWSRALQEILDQDSDYELAADLREGLRAMED